MLDISDFVTSTYSFTEQRKKVTNTGITVESQFLDLKEELLWPNTLYKLISPPGIVPALAAVIFMLHNSC